MATDYFEPQANLCQRYLLAGLLFEAKLALFRDRFVRKYSQDQPRVAAGSPDGGQWASVDGGVSAIVEAVGEALAELPTILLAGGFGKEDMGKTVQDFVSENCRGSIRSELPGQFLDFTLQDLLAMKRSGDRAAQTCYKLLNENRFRKSK